MNNFRRRARLIRTRRRRSFSHIYYVVSDEDDEPISEFCPISALPPDQCVNVVRLIESSERNGSKFSNKVLNLGTRRMIENKLFREHVLPLKTNKVFCSEWLSDDRIVMGTKCNKLLVFDIKLNCVFHVPKLQNSHNHSRSPDVENGIHAVALNPSKTFLVSGGPHSNDVAVFSLPNFEPVCVGENGHKDWIFDLKWIDDECFVSGSRDGKIALWNVSKVETHRHSLGYYYINPVAVRKCKLADKVRALSFKPFSMLTALSSNSYLHKWDMTRFEQLSSHKLPYSRETVSLTQSIENNLFAIGSSSHITFVDNSSLAVVTNIRTRLRESSVRSLSFRGNTVTIGTGFGTLHFYDLMAGKYLEHSEYVTNPMSDFRQHPSGDFSLSFYTGSFVHTAVYTHGYDSTGTRLFTAGGPWALNTQGCYAALWQ